MVCKHCGHRPEDHLDRAIRSCAPELPTGIDANSGFRMPRAQRCDCPGWECAC